VGTDKRERQKANRQWRLEEVAKEQRRQKTRRRALQFGIGIPVAIILAFVLVTLLGNDDEGETQSATTVATGTPPGSDGTETTLATATTAAATASTEAPAATVPGTTITGETPCPEADGSSERAIAFESAPPMCIDETKTYTAVVETNHGPFTVELDAAKAPETVNNFVVLSRYHFFDGIVCHRAIPGFVVQCGDPEGTGRGGPGYEFADELPEQGEYQIGSLAMANSGPDTNGSQFFIITGDQGAALPPSYSLFGSVTDGLDTTVVALDALGNADPASGGVPPLGLIQISSVTITES
jgi:cyclophilin family peptidyl-prolyl cis-trans isomerase